VIERLHRGASAWGEIKVTKSKLRVAGVAAGTESDLRHFLESAVLQAGANLADEDRSEDDQRMTDAFRAFSD
jgi:hypothetical protein